MLWLCMCADAVCPGVGCFSLILRMNMCERIYFTVDVSGTSNLFSRFVHLWLAFPWRNKGFPKRKMWGSQWVQPMVGPWWTLVPGAASWSWRLWLALLFGWPDTWKNSLARTVLCLFPLQLWCVLCPCFQAGTIPRYTIVPCAGCEPEALPWMQAVCLKMQNLGLQL